MGLRFIRIAVVYLVVGLVVALAGCATLALQRTGQPR